MFWADEIAKKLDKKKPQLVDDAWSTSGFAHVGSLRGIIIHDIANKTLLKDCLDSKFTFILDDIDPMDGMPNYLNSKEYDKEMGKPLCDIPSPIDKDMSLARYFGDDFIETAKITGTNPVFIWNSELYKTGRYNEAIEIALNNASRIAELYKSYSGAEKGESWYPFQPICEKCGKIGTTTVIDWDGKYVEYICEETKVDWAKGCNHRGKISPFDGNGKLYWRVEWPARWWILDVTVEGEGKDHWSAGGSRDLADILTKEVFNYMPPVDIRYDWLYIKGKKMSSSKGLGVTAREMAELLPKEVLRYLMAKNPKKTIDFDPSGNTIPNLFDDYDRAMSAYKNEIDFPDMARAYEIVQENAFETGYRMRFSKVSLTIQMPRLNIFEEAEKEKKSKLTKYETEKLEERIKYAKLWIDKYAPENFIFKVIDDVKSKSLDKAISELSSEQREFLKILLKHYSSQNNWLGDELHSKLHEIKNDTKIEPKEAFGSIYKLFLGKDSGPQAGWLIASLDKELVTEILRKATE